MKRLGNSFSAPPFLTITQRKGYKPQHQNQLWQNLGNNQKERGSPFYTSDTITFPSLNSTTSPKNKINQLSTKEAPIFRFDKMLDINHAWFGSFKFKNLGGKHVKSKRVVCFVWILLLFSAKNVASESNPLLSVFNGINPRKTSTFTIDVAVLSQQGTIRSSDILDNCENIKREGSLMLVYSWIDKGFDVKLYTEKTGLLDSFVPGMPQAYLNVYSDLSVSCNVIRTLWKEIVARDGGMATNEGHDKFQKVLEEIFFRGRVKRVEYVYYFLDLEIKRTKD